MLKFRGFIYTPIVFVTTVAYFTTTSGFAFGLFPKEILSYLVVIVIFFQLDSIEIFVISTLI